MIKGLLIDVISNQVKPVETEDELKEFYKLLNCDCIDIVRRPVAGKEYTFIIDDNGLSSDNPIPSCVSSRGVELVGNVLIFNDNEIGDGQASLEQADIDWIMNNVTKAKFANKSKLTSIMKSINNNELSDAKEQIDSIRERTVLMIN